MQLARIARGDENRVQIRDLRENPLALRDLRLHDRRVVVVLAHVRVPHPHVHAVSVHGAGKVQHHVKRIAREERGVERVVRARGQQLDRVRAEEQQVADVAVEVLKVPRRAGVLLVAVGELVPTKLIARRQRKIRKLRRRAKDAVLQVELAQHVRHAVQAAAPVPARDGHAHVVRLKDGDAKALRAGGFQGVELRPRLRPGRAHVRLQADHHGRARRAQARPPLRPDAPKAQLLRKDVRRLRGEAVRAGRDDQVYRHLLSHVSSVAAQGCQQFFSAKRGPCSQMARI